MNNPSQVLAQQPITDTDDLAKAVAEFEAALPGWWWTTGTCSISRDASCGPDRNGPDKHLLEIEQFDSGFHHDDRTGSVANSLRTVMAYALKAKEQANRYDRGKIDINHAIKPGRLYDSDRSDLIWLPEHVAKFCTVASDELKLAMVLAIYTGQRQGDLIKMTWGQYDGQWINHRQGKGKKRVSLPVHPDLKKVLDNIPRRSTLILTTPTGVPWKSDWFRNRWRDASKAANIQDLHFHDLRGTAVTMLAEAGCSHAEIAAITGHSLSHVETILVKYLSLTRDLARSAMTKLENAGGSDFSGLV